MFSKLKTTVAVLATLVALPATAQDIELRFIHYQSGNQPALRAILDDFESQNPGIKVTDLPSGGAQTVVSEIQAASAAKRPFDVGQVLARTALGVINIGAAQPFSKCDDGGALWTRSPRTWWMWPTSGDERYMMPHSFGTPLMYINADLMAQGGLRQRHGTCNHARDHRSGPQDL